MSLKKIIIIHWSNSKAMGSCLCTSKNNQVFDVRSNLDSLSCSDVYVERITHIQADIHEKIRKRIPNKEPIEYNTKDISAKKMSLIENNDKFLLSSSISLDSIDCSRWKMSRKKKTLNTWRNLACKIQIYQVQLCRTYQTPQ